MDAKAKRRTIIEMLAKLQQDMLAAVERTPDDWDEVALSWYLLHRARRRRPGPRWGRWRVTTALPSARSRTPCDEVDPRCGRIAQG